MKMIIMLAALVLTGCAASKTGSVGQAPCQEWTGNYDPECLAELKSDKEESIIQFINDNPKYTKYKEKAIKGYISIGMPEELVLLSWGKPFKLNESVYSTGVHKQMIYRDAYVYIRNGILTSWQDRN